MLNTCHYLTVVLCAFVSLTCEESLPIYEQPQNVLAVNVSLVEQLADRIARPGRQVAHIVVVGENIHDEVFQDSVNIRGTMRIWWQRKPGRYRTIYLTEQNLVERNLVRNGKMLLIPGQQFTMDTYWNLKSDDSLYLPTEMNFARLTQRVCDYNIACSDPEVFVIEVSLNVFDRIGYVLAPPKEFTFIGRVCIDCGIGPVCPPPPGGCG